MCFELTCPFTFHLLVQFSRKERISLDWNIVPVEVGKRKTVPLHGVLKSEQKLFEVFSFPIVNLFSILSPVKCSSTF